ncbi:MAG: HPr family phosphocarrier protein [Acidobacteriota bacterium]|nr:HPr family phosphocarrier protein [Acidobacteriota bacterium]
MLESEVKVVNPLGLHARAAAQLVRAAGRFDSDIKLKRADNNRSADAKSILSVLTLAAAKGTKIGIMTVGSDEKEALQSIKQLFADGFGEI